MRHLLTTTAMAAILASGAALAQDNQLPPTGATPQPAEPPQVIWTEAEGSWLSDDLIGAEVVNNSGESLGTIDTLVISLAAHGDHTAMPKTDAQGDDPNQSAAQSQAIEEPAEAQTAAEEPTAGEDQPIEEDFASESSAPSAEEPIEAQEKAADAAPADTAPAEEEEQIAEEAPTDGETLMAPGEGDAGDIRVTNVVVGVGGFLGIGEKLVSVPVDQLEFFAGDRGERKIVLNASREELENMPGFVETDQEMVEELPSN